jgi:hypothetical protein
MRKVLLCGLIAAGLLCIGPVRASVETILQAVIGKLNKTAPTSGLLVAGVDTNGKLIGIQLDGSGQLKVAGTFSASGATDTVGSTASLGALNDAVNVALAGEAGCGVHVASGLTGTLTPELSIDNGTTWFATKFIDTAGATTATQVLSGGALDTGIVVLGGARKCRVRVSSYTSGSASSFCIATYTSSAGASGGGGGSVTQGTSPWVTQDNHTTAAVPLSLRLSDGAAFYKATTPSDTQPVSNANLDAALSTLATQATLSTLNGKFTDDTAGSTFADEAATNRLAARSALLLYDSTATVNQRLLAWQGDSTNGAWVNVKSSAAIALAAGAATIGSLAANQSVNVAMINGVTPLMGNGVTGTGSQRVTIASDNTAFSVNSVQSGTWTVQPGNTANTTPWLIDLSKVAGTNTVTGGVAGTLGVGGLAADDAAAAGNPLLNGLTATGANRAAVSADGDVVKQAGDMRGRALVAGCADRSLISKSGVVTLTSTTETTLLAAGGSGVFLDAYYLHCDNTSTTFTRVDIRDSTGGTVRDVLVCPAAAGPCGGAAPTTPLPQNTSNNNWTIQLSAAVTDVRCVMYACQAK